MTRFDGRWAEPTRQGLAVAPWLAAWSLAVLAPVATGLVGCAPTSPGGAPAVETSEEVRQLHQLFDDAWERRLADDPLFATSVGDHRYDDRLPTVTEEQQQLEAAWNRQLLERLAQIPRQALPRTEQINYDIFERLTRDQVAEAKLRSYLIPFTSSSGYHTDFPQLPERTPLSTVAQYEAYISRLRAFSRYSQEHVELMRTGLREGYTLPRIVLEGWQAQVAPHLVEDPEESLLFAPFRSFPATFSPEDQERLRAEGRDAVATSLVPAYRELYRFLDEEYVPGAREEVGAFALPHGRDFYAHRVRRFTTLDVTPEEVHDKGLAEVARIRGEMEEVMRQVGFQGNLGDFLTSLRRDPRFFTKTPEELLSRVSYVLKRMDGKLPELFRTLPRTPYGIKEIPAYIAPKTYPGYYEPPAGDGSRAGYYAVNTYNLPSRPLYEIESLSFHEAVPGHHLQIALQQELQDLPKFRRFGGFTAFTEGWALYSERLGLEVGFYRDPYSNFGRLTYEMWRALRLVVDTGMHAFGWSRQRAIDLMAANSALSLHNITTEVDRYISWPGQSLAYKTGELKIRELRRRAEEELGPDFDLRAFHDVVLLSGAVPLSVLEENVELYIRRVKEQRAEG